MEYDRGSFDAFGGKATAFRASDNPGGIEAAIEAAIGPVDEPVMAAPPDTTVRLPFGRLLDGAALTAALVRELTGADDEALAKVVSSPLRWVDTVIALGTEVVGEAKATKELLRELTVADRDTLLLAIRRVTYGDEIKVAAFRCPACGELSDLTIHLDAIPIRTPEDPACRVFEAKLRDGSTAQLRQATGHDQMAFEGKTLTIAEQNTLMLARTIVTAEVGGVAMSGSMALARSLGLGDRRILLDAIVENSYGPQYGEVAMTHEACGEEVPIPLTPGDLFRGL